MSNRTELEAVDVERDDLPGILLKAAEVIETRGWHRGDFFDQQAHFDRLLPIEQCGVCVRGALNVAAGFDPIGSDYGHEDARDDVLDALAFHLGYEEERDVSTAYFLATWNDSPRRTKEQVTKALRDCAAELSEETTR